MANDGKRKRPPKPPTEVAIRAALDREFARWDYMKEYGCQDPFWSDGINMNLTRKHIIFYYRQLQEAMGESVDLMNERPVPPEVPNDYMAPNGRYPDRLEGRSPRHVAEES